MIIKNNNPKAINQEYLVENLGDRLADGETIFQYDVLFSSLSCIVSFAYVPIDEELEKDGRIACDVDVRAGGDCVGMLTVQECIAAAWEAHCALDVAKRFRMTDDSQ